MKLTPARWATFLRKPDPSVGAILLFGPDRGLVRERADQLATMVLGDSPDPFRSAELTSAQLRATPSSLADEALAFGLVPGRRLLRVRDAGDAMVEAVRLLLSGGRSEAFVVLEAADLGKRSSLRELMEGAANAAAVPCYEDDPETLRAVIGETLRGAGLLPTADMLDFLSAHLGSDRGVTRSELEKLVLYMGADPSGQPRPVTLDDVAVVVGDARSAMLGAVAMAVGSGDRAMVVRALAQAAGDGLEPIALLRMLASHLQRLYVVAGEMAAGRSPKEAVGALRPPVFFRELDAFARQARRWTPAALERAMLAVLEAEMRCKQTAAPQRMLTEQVCLAVAAMAPSGR